MKRFTTSYYDDYDYESEYGKQPEGFDTAEEAVKWNDERNIPPYIIKVTEWDLDNLDYQGVPEIIESTNLEDHATVR